MPKILVFGRSGQLAQAVADTAKNSEFTCHFSGKNEFDLTAQSIDIFEYILDFSPIDAVINASAYTHVDHGEFKQAEQAWRLNALAPAPMAKACNTLNIPLLHISTESVFDGQKSAAYRPDDAPKPANFYGVSKRAGEQMVLAAYPHAHIFRTSWLFSASPNNFVTSILKLAKANTSISVVNDQFGYPTYTPDFADALLAALAQIMHKNTGHFAQIYHLTSAGNPVSKFEFAKTIIKTAGLGTRVHPVTTAQYHRQFGIPAPRPHNARLDSSQFTASFNIQMPDWQTGLADMVQQTGR